LCFSARLIKQAVHQFFTVGLLYTLLQVYCRSQHIRTWFSQQLVVIIWSFSS